MDMEVRTYRIVPRSPIRGIGNDIITKETEMELNELQALKILLAGNQLYNGFTPVTIKDFVPDVDPQCINVGSLVDDPTNKGTKFTASSECKVFGNPRYYNPPIIDTTTAVEEGPEKNEEEEDPSQGQDESPVDDSETE